jgi:transposase
MQGSKYGDEIKEKAYALLMAGNNVSFVSKQLGLPYNTIKGWKSNFEKEDDNFSKLRNKKKEEFIEDSWKIINLANTLLERRLARAITSEDDLDELVAEITELDYKKLTDSQRKGLYAKVAAIKVEDVGKIATVLGTLYDKQALANNEATVNAGIKVTLGGDLDKYAD